MRLLLFLGIAAVLCALKLWLPLLIYGGVIGFFGLGGAFIRFMPPPPHMDYAEFTKKRRRDGSLLLVLGILCMIVGGLAYRGVIQF